MLASPLEYWPRRFLYPRHFYRRISQYGRDDAAQFRHSRHTRQPAAARIGHQISMDAARHARYRRPVIFMPHDSYRHAAAATHHFAAGDLTLLQ